MAINYLSVLVAAIAAFALGAVWHGPLFGKLWMKLSGITMQSMKKMKVTPTKSMSLGFVSLLVASYVVAYFVKLLGYNTFAGGAQFAFWAWLGLVAPVNFGAYLWEGKSLKLASFNALYRLVELIVIAGVTAVLA